MVGSGERKRWSARFEVGVIVGAAIALAAAVVLSTERPAAVATVLFAVMLVWSTNAAVELPSKVGVSPSFMVVVGSLAAFNGRGAVLGAGIIGLCGGLLLTLIRRRRFRSLLFNCAQYVLAGEAAAVIEAVLRAHAWPHPAALMTATLGFAAVNVGLVLPAVALDAGEPVAVVWADMSPTFPNYLAFGLMGSLIGQLYHRLGPLSVVFLVSPLVIARSVFGAFLRLREAYRRLEVLYGFTRSMGGTLDVDTVMRTTLTDVQRLLQARVVEVLLPAEDGAIVRTVLASDGEILTSVVNGTGPRLFENAVLESGEAFMASVATAEPVLAEALTQRGLSEVIVVPIQGQSGVVGVMLVADRIDGASRFVAEDRQLLETLANHAAVAFQNGRLVERLRWESLHDALTGLANRASFHASVQAAATVPDSIAVGAVLLMDLDRFKEVNDTLGHESGDALLQAVGERLVAELGGDASIARLGGDEFGALFTNVHDEAGATRAAERMLAVLDHPFKVGDIELDVDGSVGITLFPDHGNDAVVLLQRADVAVYQAKQFRGGWEFYSAERDLNTPRRLAMARELHTALLDGGLSVHYQPKAELADGRVTGVEVLARWNHSSDGFIPPDEFVPLAEHTGLIRPLTYWVLAVAINQCGAWRRQGIHVNVAVNLSMRVLVDGNLTEQIVTLLDEAGLPASGLTLEITESTIMSDPIHSIQVLRRLSELGITLSIDDFGTGYSSLAYLKRLPVGEVKIDRSFVMAMCSDMADAAIVRSTIDLAHNLGLRVVAEGIEDSATWAELARLGCHAGQGYLLARPMPGPEFERWLSGYLAKAPGP